MNHQTFQQWFAYSLLLNTAPIPEADLEIVKRMPGLLRTHEEFIQNFRTPIYTKPCTSMTRQHMPSLYLLVAILQSWVHNMTQSLGFCSIVLLLQFMNLQHQTQCDMKHATQSKNRLHFYFHCPCIVTKHQAVEKHMSTYIQV